MSKKTVWSVLVLIVIGLSLYRFRPDQMQKQDLITATNASTLNRKEAGGDSFGTSARTNHQLEFSSDSERALMEKELDDQWSAPITFYGKAVDEEGLGIPDAEVELSWNNLSGTLKRTLRTESDGTFEVNGENGHALIVVVKKDGYYTSRADNRVFYYGTTQENHQPDKENPSLFHLHKMRGAERLIQVKRNLKVERDGSALKLDLASGLLQDGQESLTVECWTEEKNASPRGEFDWKCRISVQGGGLVLSTNEFGFIAPEAGYSNYFDFEMIKEKPEQWSREAHAKFFFKTGNGNYGSLSFTMVAFGDHFCMIESFLNPTGSRNVEYNGANAVRMPRQ